MSNFSAALNDVLDRLKTDRNMTRQDFAKMAGMPLSTLATYYGGVNNPTREALTQIAGALEEEDASRLIVAHLADETPEGWLDRLSVARADRVAEGPDADGRRLSQYDFLPQKFVRQMEALLREAQRNEHIMPFIDEFVACLGLQLEGDESWQNPPASKFPTHHPSVPDAPSGKRRGASTPGRTARGAGAGSGKSGSR